ncbi:MAG: hypothetical protein ACI36W_00425 [Coriobacteriales bacterium]
MGVMRRFFKQGEEGFTTAGTAVALLLAVVLAFGAVQAHWVQARAGQVQYVADAAALAADGAVAELVLYAQAIDASLLSLSLLGLSAYAASGVAAFIPGGQLVAEQLASLGAKVLKTRDSFASSAQKGLNAAYRALPALCTMRALQVMEANSRASGQEYCGVAVPLPLLADELQLQDSSAAQEAGEQIEGREQQVEEDVKRQQEAAEHMDSARAAGWEADCGNAQSLRERAGSLAGLQGADNPSFSSSQTWSFSAPLDRAQRYYRARLKKEQELELSSDPRQAARQIARRSFYEYALEEVSKGSVSKDDSGFEQVDLKSLPANPRQLRETSLYRKEAFPVSSGEGGERLHAWEGCPAYTAATPAGTGSLEELDRGLLGECPECGFDVSMVGMVPVATTATELGFEHYYGLVVKAADDYNSAARELQETSSRLQDAASQMQESFKQGLESLEGGRLRIQPPGRYGCLVLVVAGSSQADVGGSFIDGTLQLGTRIAISAACLATDPQVDQTQALQAIAAGLVPGEGLVSGLAKTLFGMWGSAVDAYSKGAEGARACVEDVLRHIPLVGTELSQWVGEGFSAVAQACNLEPVEVEALKPVLCASQTVLEADGSGLSQGLIRAKQGAEYASQVSLGDVSQVLELLVSVDLGNPDADGADKIVLAALSLVAGGLGTGERELSIELDKDAVVRFAQAVAQVKGVL